MVCRKCSHWKCEKLSYDELLQEWHKTIGGTVTPGHLERYKRVALEQGVPLDELRIGYKYCSAGQLSRFYLMKCSSDQRPAKALSAYPRFTQNEEVDASKFRRICAVESHSLSEVKGIVFTPGLYENNSYTRVPLFGSTRPQIERTDANCSSCGNRTDRVLVVRIEKTFCCNEHYLEWWAKMYREEYLRLSQEAIC